MEALDIVGAALLAVCLVLLLLVGRRRLLTRPAGTLEMSLRRRPGSHVAGGWSFGVARYEGDRLEWFPTFSVSLRPRVTLSRGALRVLSQRAPKGSEALAVVHHAVIVECVAGDHRVELAIPEQAWPGFLAWVESAPDRVRA